MIYLEFNQEEEVNENSFECKLYFWQGRDANNAGWLTFSFTLKKKFKERFEFLVAGADKTAKRESIPAINIS